MFVEQTALMQACQYGHWEVVLTLVLFKANVRLFLQQLAFLYISLQYFL